MDGYRAGTASEDTQLCKIFAINCTQPLKEDIQVDLYHLFRWWSFLLNSFDLFTQLELLRCQCGVGRNCPRCATCLLCSSGKRAGPSPTLEIGSGCHGPFGRRFCIFAWLLRTDAIVILVGAAYASHSGYCCPDRTAYFEAIGKEWRALQGTASSCPSCLHE